MHVISGPKGARAAHRQDVNTIVSQPSSTDRAAGDWFAAAALFAILGGGAALLLADWSITAAALAAVVSGIVGILFADA